MTEDPRPEVALIEKSQTIGRLAKALAAAQSEMKHAATTSDNPFFKSKYADLAEVVDTCKEPLSKNGIARYQGPVSDEKGTPGVATMLMHESGEWICTTIYCEPKDRGPQAVGSVLTYLRRYSLAAAVGLAQEDDDAESAQPRQAAKKREPVEPRPIKRAAAPIEQHGPSHAELLAKARHIIGMELRWDVKQSSAWLTDQTGKAKLAELNPDELTAVIHLLTLYGDEKQYPDALEDYRKRGLLREPEARAS